MHAMRGKHVYFNLHAFTHTHTYISIYIMDHRIEMQEGFVSNVKVYILLDATAVVNLK
jgi:hypothetical protein